MSWILASRFASAWICCALAVALCGCDIRNPTVPDVPTHDASDPGRPARAEGAPYTVEMPGPAASAYRAGGSENSETVLTRLISRNFDGLGFDSCLRQAAAGYAHGLDQLGADPPLDFTEFVLHWAGCPDATAAVSTLSTDHSGDEVFLEHLARVLDGGRFTHIGVVRTEAEDFRARWVTVLVERNFTLREVPTTTAPGSLVPLMFSLAGSYSAATVYVTRPGGSVQSFDVGLGGGWAVSSVPMGEETGRHWIELLAEGPAGPEVVALFPVEVGREPPDIWVGECYADEAWISSTEQAEAYLLDLVNRDRGFFGLQPLSVDPRLGRMARAHSEDMVSSGFFGHVSPSTGDISDRLRGEGYLTSVAMENLASSRTLAEAQEGLMRSPGHRAAILSHEVTHVGIGVVRQEDADSGGTYLVTQIFSKPFVPQTPHQLGLEIERAIRSRRDSLRLQTRVRSSLSELAAELAEEGISDAQVLQHQNARISRRVNEIDSSLGVWRAFWGNALTIDDVKLPEVVEENDIRAIGIGVARGPGQPLRAPNTFMVLLVY